MPLFDGVLTVDNDEVPVIIGLDDNGIRMSTGGTEIGEWPLGQFTIDARGEGIYTITADDETIQFVPNRPDLFAVDFGGGPAPRSQAAAPPADTGGLNSAEQDSTTSPTSALVMALFYTLAGTTVFLGLLALYRLF